MLLQRHLHAVIDGLLVDSLVLHPGVPDFLVAPHDIGVVGVDVGAQEMAVADSPVALAVAVGLVTLTLAGVKQTAAFVT